MTFAFKANFALILRARRSGNVLWSTKPYPVIPPHGAYSDMQDKLFFNICEGAAGAL